MVGLWDYTCEVGNSVGYFVGDLEDLLDSVSDML